MFSLRERPVPLLAGVSFHRRYLLHGGAFSTGAALPRGRCAGGFFHGRFSLQDGACLCRGQRWRPSSARGVGLRPARRTRPSSGRAPRSDDAPAADLGSCGRTAGAQGAWPPERTAGNSQRLGYARGLRLRNAHAPLTRVWASRRGILIYLCLTNSGEFFSRPLPKFGGNRKWLP